jgi:hypothetical protein
MITLELSDNDGWDVLVILGMAYILKDYEKLPDLGKKVLDCLKCVDSNRLGEVITKQLMEQNPEGREESFKRLKKP